MWPNEALNFTPWLAENIAELGEITGREFRQGIIGCLYNGRKGIYDDLSAIPIGWYDQEISCVVRTDDEVTGFLLVHRTPSGSLMPVLFYAGGPNSRMDLLGMLIFAIQRAGEECPPDTKVLIRRHSHEVRALSDNLFPGVKGREILYGERTE